MALRVPCGVLAAAPQRAAVPSARPRLPAARLSRGLSRLQVAVTDDSGYESSADDNVMSGKGAPHAAVFHAAELRPLRQHDSPRVRHQ